MFQPFPLITIQRCYGSLDTAATVYDAVLYSKTLTMNRLTQIVRTIAQCAIPHQTGYSRGLATP